RQDPAPRSRHAAWRGLRRGAGGWRGQGRGRLPQRHGDVRGGGRSGQRRITRPQDRSRSPVNRNRWNAVDAYFTETIVVPDRALEEALAANAAAGLPSIDVSAPQG